MKPVILDTQRLTLTGYTPQDISYIFEHYPKEKIMNLLGHRSESDYAAEEYKYKNGYAAYNRGFLLFILTHKSSRTPIGRCGLHNWNTEHRRAELGYVISDDLFKRKGLMTEAVRAILDYGFNRLKLHRIEALVGSTNTPSLKILENHNFTKEGLLRQHYCINGEFADSVLFSLLHHEYAEPKNNQPDKP